MAEKTARLIERLIADGKTNAARVAQLERELATASEHERQAIAQVTAQLRQEIERVRAAGDADVDKWHQRYRVIAEELAVLTVSYDAAEHARRLAEQETLRVMEQVSELQGKIDALAPQFADLEEREARLAKICDTVRERMHRRERTEEQAILNRGVLGALSPERNRGG